MNKFIIISVLILLYSPNNITAATLFDDDIDILAAGGSRCEIEIDSPGTVSIKVDITKGNNLDLIFFESSTYAFGWYDPDFGDDSSDALLYRQNFNDQTFSVKIDTAGTYVIQFFNDALAEASVTLIITITTFGDGSSEDADNPALSLSYFPIVMGLITIFTLTPKVHFH